MADLINLQQTIPKSNYGIDVFNILFAKHLAGGGESSAIIYTSIIDNGDNTITAIDEDGNEHIIIYTLDTNNKIDTISLDGESHVITYSGDTLTQIDGTDIDVTDFPTCLPPDMIIYKNIQSDDDNTLYMIDNKDVNHDIEYELSDDGKITSVTLDGKTQLVTYEGDVLTKIGNTDVDMEEIPVASEFPVTVTFMNGTDIYGKVGITDGMKIAEPAKPSGEGIFDGWYDNDTKIVFPYQPNVNKTLTSVFTSAPSARLYSAFNVSEADYPYIMIYVNPNSFLSIYFSKSYSISSGKGICTGTKFQTIKAETRDTELLAQYALIKEDVNAVTNFVILNVPKVFTEDSVSTPYSTWYQYSNVTESAGISHQFVLT